MTAKTTTEREAKELPTLCLMRILKTQAIPFVTSAGDVWISIPDKSGVYTHHRLESPAVREWLMGRYYQCHNAIADVRDITNVLTTFSGFAKETAEMRDVFMRIALVKRDGVLVELWVDLGEGGKAVKITPGQWEVADAPQGIAFLRPKGYLPLPVPERGGHIDNLRPFLNCGAGEQGELNWRKMVAWLIGAFNPEADQAILVLNGEKGSGKSTTGTVLRSLVDPNVAENNPCPESQQDVMFQGTRAWVVSYDNLSKITVTLSDAFCRISTGEALGKRRLYTDEDPILWSFKRPVIVNGIERLIVRPDMAQRSIEVELPFLEDDAADPARRRKYSKTELLCKLDKVRPRIFGAVLDAVACAMERLEEVKQATTVRFRLGDFHLWVTAAEPALGWPEGAMTNVMRGQKRDVHQATLCDRPVIQVLLDYLRDPDRHKAPHVATQANGTRTLAGKSSELLHWVTAYAREHSGYDTRDHRLGWPGSDRTFSNVLRSSQATLAEMGVTLSWRSLDGRSLFELTYHPPQKDKEENSEVGKVGNEIVADPIPLPAGPMTTAQSGQSGESGQEVPFSDGEEKEKKEEERKGEREQGVAIPLMPLMPLEPESQPSRGSGQEHRAATLPTLAPSVAYELDTADISDAEVYRPQGINRLRDESLAPWEKAYALLPTCSHPDHVHDGDRCLVTALPLDYYPADLPPDEIAYQCDESGVTVDVAFPSELASDPFRYAAAGAYARAAGMPIGGRLQTGLTRVVRQATRAKEGIR